ncbi:MAG: response regulator, partial [Clostridiales bacterium]|nr:response regulator [Clostridiales bacterium]
MNILICDDEELYVENIKKHIELYGFEKSLSFDIDTYTDAQPLLKCNTHYDIAFLDVEIGNIKGTDVAKRLKEINNFIVIFIITSYDKYLDDAMDLNVLRFIVKPIDSKRLYNGLDKAISLIDNSIVDLFLKNGTSHIKLPVNEIMFIEVEG